MASFHYIYAQNFGGNIKTDYYYAYIHKMYVYNVVEATPNGNVSHSSHPNNAIYREEKAADEYIKHFTERFPRYRGIMYTEKINVQYRGILLGRVRGYAVVKTTSVGDVIIGIGGRKRDARKILTSSIDAHDCDLYIEEVTFLSPAATAYPGL